MGREQFTSSKWIIYCVFGISAIFFAIAFLLTDIGVWPLLLVIFTGALFIYFSSKSKLVIEEGQLRYEKIIGKEEVELKNVAKIVLREVETIGSPPLTAQTNREISREDMNFLHDRFHTQERKVEQIVYVIDEYGHTVFSFPGSLIKWSERARFRQAVHKYNPKIEVFKI